MTIFIDPGHGGSDGGACANGLEEKTVNLSVALKTAPLLEAAGIRAVLSRKTDVFIPVMDRPAAANAAKADRFISIHHNGGGGVGYEIYRSVRNDAGGDMAAKIAARYVALGRKPHNGGVQTRASGGSDYYGVIRGAHMPALLSEFCYLDSPDFKAINSEALQQAEAQAIADGIIAHLGVKAAQPVSAPAPSATSAAAPGGMPQISQGAQGDAVKTLQNDLGRLGLTGADGKVLAVDGAFGANTAYALKEFQRQHSLAADGVAGPKTWAALVAAAAAPAKAAAAADTVATAHTETVKAAGTWNVRSAPQPGAKIVGCVRQGDSYVTAVGAGGWRQVPAKGGYVSPLAW